MSELSNPPKDKTRNYVTSKTGNLFLAAELARRSKDSGIISIAQNPGAANTELFRHVPWMKILAWPLLYKSSLAANTELFAGLAPEVKEGSGGYVVPWGRMAKGLRKDLLDAMKVEEEGGTGRAKEFWGFCEEVTRRYL